MSLPAASSTFHLFITHSPTSKNHHLIYACQSFSGDCGVAVVLHDGKLVGLQVSATSGKLDMRVPSTDVNAAHAG